MRQSLRVTFDEFGWSSLQREAQRVALPAEEVVRHAVAYYLADRDSRRSAFRIPAALAAEVDRQASSA
jgi:hypothetical protein